MKNWLDEYEPAPSDATRVNRTVIPKDVLLKGRVTQQQLDERVANDRRKRIADSNSAKNEKYTSKNWKSKLARETQATGDKLRRSPYPNFFDDYINPAAMIGNMASGLGQVPLDIEQGNYGQAALNVALPLATGALAGIGAKTTGQFVNNLVNPLAGTSDLVNNLGNKHLSNLNKISTITPQKSGFIDFDGVFQKYPKGPLTKDEILAYRNSPRYKKVTKEHLDAVNKYGDIWKLGNYMEDDLQKAIATGNRNRVNQELYGGRNWTVSDYIIAGTLGTAYPAVLGLYGLASSPPMVKNKVMKNIGISGISGGLSSKDTTIDITNRPMDFAKVNETKDGQVIIGGEFIEDANNTVRKAKDWLTARDTYSDKKYSSKDIQSFYGIENGKFKVGKANEFNENTEIVPRRFGAIDINKAVLNGNEMRLLDKEGNPIYQNTPNTGKFILYSPSTGRSQFTYINNGKSGVDKVNKFLKNNKDAQYIHLDNGRYEYYGINPEGLTERDFYNYYEQDLKREGNPGYNMIIKRDGGSIETDVFTQQKQQEGGIINKYENGGEVKSIQDYDEDKKPKKSANKEVKPIIVNDKNDYRLKKYQDSLYVYNKFNKLYNDLLVQGKQGNKGVVEQIRDKMSPKEIDYFGDLGLPHSYKGLKPDYVLGTKTPRENRGYLPHYKKPKQPVIYEKPIPVIDVTKEDVKVENPPVIKSELENNGYGWVKDLQTNEMHRFHPITGELEYPFKGGQTHVNPKNPKNNSKLKMNMGGSLPGVTGMMYARTGAPSNGKYAKKTKPSAEDGIKIETYSKFNKLDNGGNVSYNQLVNFTNYNKPTSGGWLDEI